MLSMTCADCVLSRGSLAQEVSRSALYY